MKLRPNSRVVVERSHANRHLRTVWPISTEEAGTAIYTKRFHSAFAFSVNLDQFFALEEVKLFLQYPRLRAHGCSRMLAAAVAMTVTRLQKGRVDFKTYAATQAAATDRFFHAKLYDKTRIGSNLRLSESFAVVHLMRWICRSTCPHNRMAEVS